MSYEKTSSTRQVIIFTRPTVADPAWMAAWAEGAELHCDLEPLIQQLQSLVEKQKDYAGRAGTCTRCFKPIQNCPHRDISIAPDPEGAKKVWEGFEW